jgi:SAM-dependent methyltransferase
MREVRVASTCVVCGESDNEGAERATVHSNVRAFRAERFGVWRCRACACIHAAEDAALDQYYEHYPFHDLPADIRVRCLHANQLGRLRRAGLRPEHDVLDYGSGEGAFVGFLRKSGYQRAQGYDPYSKRFAEPQVLQRQYDCVFSQDCIEHVDEPLALLARFDELTRPGGVIAIGTPDAEAIDLRRPEAFAHTLHAPYHRHILARRALVEAGERRGWRLERAYPTMYSNTRVPFLNERFYRHYLSVTDDTLDALVEPVRVAPLLARLPETLFYGLFGSLQSRGTDISVIFRKP